MEIKQEIKDRLAYRLKTMQDTNDPIELAYTIWTKGLDEAKGSSQDCYRLPFIAWINAYKNNETPKEWTKYKTPKDLAEGLWKPYLDCNDEDVYWFGSLRSCLIKWIEDYESNSSSK